MAINSTFITQRKSLWLLRRANSRRTFSDGNHGPGDVSSNLSFAAYISRLEKKP